MKQDNDHAKIRIAACCSLFILLVGYFAISYSFYPGLSIGFHGTLDRSISGRLFWDYGDGFTELDFISVTLLSENQPVNEALGDITIESTGLRNTKSRGDMIWLVLAKNDFEAGEYVIEGKHQWMHWLNISANRKGRQLALFPGSRIILTNQPTSANLYFFKTPDSGIARISSKNGPERFYDGYGKNKPWGVSHFSYHADVAGDIAFVIDPYREKNLTILPLPHQKIKGLKFEPVKEDMIAGIDTIKELVIRPFLEGETIVPGRIKSIKVNGKPVDISSADAEFNVTLQNTELIFDDQRQYVRIKGPIYAFEIEYLPHENITPFQVYLDGQIYETKVEQRSSDKVHYITGEAGIDYQGLALNSFEVTDVKGDTHLFKIDGNAEHAYIIDRLAGVKQKQFNWLLLSVQVLTAAFISLVLYWLTTLSPFRESKSLKELAFNTFFRQGRWLFWLLFIIGITINLLWLLAEWPGSLTPDSVHVHSGIKQLRITNHHPYLYSLFILGLYNVYDSLLTVILFQIITYNCLVAGFMYILFKNGLRWWLIVPLCCLIFLLIPVNLYNMTVWKDIPFTTLLLFWAFFITICFYKKRYIGTQVKLTNVELILLVLLFLSLCTFRHNGIIYIIFIPVSLFFFSNISRYWLMKFVSLSATLFLLYYFVFPPLVLYKNSKSNNFAKHVVGRTMQRASKITEKEEGFYLEHYLGDRMEKFITSLGTSSTASTWYNDMNDPPQRWFSVDELRSAYKTHPISEELQPIKNKLLQSRDYKGFTKGRFIHWNSLFSLLGMIVVFLLYRWLPLSAFYSSFFLFQTAALFFVVWARWRYMYFLYLGGFFLLFVVLLELVGKKSEKRLLLNRQENLLI